VLALGFAAGILAAAHVPVLLAVAGGVSVWAWSAQRGGHQWARVLVLFTILGVLRAGMARQDGQVARTSCTDLADDRAADEVDGVVRGPVEDAPGLRRFVVETGAGLRVLVSARGSRRPAVLPGDRVRVVGRLRTPRGYRVPGALDSRRWLRLKGAQLMLSTRAERVAIRAPAARFSLWRMPVALQRRAARLVDGRPGLRVGKAVVRAMTLGDRGGLDEATVAAFRGAGVSHVLAVSGLHLAVVAALLFAVARRLWGWLPGLWSRVSAQRAAALVAACGSIGFALLTGGRVSTLRALLVTLAVLFGVATARRARLIDVLGAAALVLLVVDPESLYDPSFQLSFAATVTLVLAFGRARPPAVSRRHRLARYVADLLRASAWATLATAPLSALTFHSVAPVGLIANVVIVPMAELVVLPIGLLGVALQLVSPTAGAPLVDVAIAAAAGCSWLAAAFARLWPPLHVPAPHPVEALALAGVWAAALCWHRRVLQRRWCVVLASFAAVIIVGSWLVTTRVVPQQRSHLRAVFLDVGQGDAAVLELPGGATWLVDSGGRPFVVPRPGQTPRRRRALAAAPGRDSVLRYLVHRRVRRLDLVVLSHPHPDHFMGLNAIIGVIPITEVWVARPPPGQRQSGAYAALLARLRRAGTRIVYPALGVARRDHAVAVRVLFPAFSGARAAADPRLSANDNSLTVAVEFAGRRLLFPGDVEADAEAELLLHRAALRADVVKVPHHGSPTSSTQAFVDAVRPLHAVISCGVANRFGFPSAAVEARWRAAGARVWRTDQNGAVTVDIAPDGHLDVWSYDTPAPCTPMNAK